MTITNTSSKVIFIGNNRATDFPFPFKINKDDDLQVRLTDENKNETILERGEGGNNYRIVRNNGSTNSVRYPATGTDSILPLNHKITISRVVDLAQQTDLQNQSVWKPEQIEAEFDYSRMVDIQQQEEIGRCIKTKISSDSEAGGTDYTLPGPEAGKVIAVWNQDEDAMEIGPDADEIVSAQSHSENAREALETSERIKREFFSIAREKTGSWTVEHKSDEDSPFTIAQDNANTLLVLDTEDDDIEVRLPLISAVSSISTIKVPFNASLLKGSDKNSVIINCDSQNTINGSNASLTIGSGSKCTIQLFTNNSDWTLLEDYDIVETERIASQAITPDKIEDSAITSILSVADFVSR